MSANLLFFSTEECTACDISAPIVKKVASKRGIKVTKCDPCEDPTSAQMYNVRVLPTVVLLNDRGEFCGELHGSVNEDSVERLLSFV